MSVVVANHLHREIVDLSAEANLGPCPKCGAPVKAFGKSYVCEKSVPTEAQPVPSCDFKSGQLILQQPDGVPVAGLSGPPAPGPDACAATRRGVTESRSDPRFVTVRIPAVPVRNAACAIATAPNGPARAPSAAGTL